MNSSFKIRSNSLEQTDQIAKYIAEAVCDSGALLCLYGDIGAGKTTLTKSIAKYLEIQEKVTSPSFVILNEYHSGKIPLYHFDLYRLEEEGVKTILDEIREYTENDNALAIVEWAQFDSGELPDDRLELNIEYIGDFERDLNFTAYGSKSSKILEEIKQIFG